MSTADYTHGEMNISEQVRTWSGFTHFALWGSFMVMMIIGYPIFTIAMGMNWMIALVLIAGAGIVGGLVLGMGGKWVAAVVGLVGLAVFVQIVITIAKMFL